MKKNALLTFIFACIPGAGQMYYGYMQRGLSLITLFCGCFILGALASPLALTCFIVWIYSFFDTYDLIRHLVGMMTGAVIDSVGFLLSSYGEPYFPGFMVTAMLSGLIYGVLLYRRKPTLLRIIVVRILINYGSNVLLGSVWKAMLYGKGYLYYATSGLVKNTIMLPIEVFVMWVVLGAAVRYGLDRKYIHGMRAR